MKGDPEQRAVQLGEYIVAHHATVRGAAQAFGCSKSTVHKDVSTRLRAVSPGLFAQVQAVLARNKAERHLRGGASFHPQLRVIAEYDSKDFALGATYLLFKHLHVQVEMQRMKYFSGGLTYKIHLK